MSDTLKNRLRGIYEVGPDAEFGERKFEVPAISLEAADHIEDLEQKLEKCKEVLIEIERVALCPPNDLVYAKLARTLLKELS